MAAELERFRRTFSQTFMTGRRVKLSVENQNGRISVSGDNPDQVVVNIVAELWAESSNDADLELQRIQRGMTAIDGTVNLRTPELLKPSGGLFGWSLARGPKVEYEISVPRETSVNVTARNSNIDIRTVQGPVDVDAQGGSVTLSQIAEEVAIKGRNGAIKVADVISGVSVTSRNGSITVDQTGGAISTEATNGSIELINAGAAVQAESRNGSVRFRGPVLGPVQIETRNGSIRLGVPKGSRFELDAISQRGSVRSDLTVRKSSATDEANSTRHKVLLKSENGSIRIEELTGAASPRSSTRPATSEPEEPRNLHSS